MKISNPKTNFYLTVAIIIFAIFGIILGGGGSIIWKIKTSSEKILEIKQQIANAEAKRDNTIKLEKEFEIIKKNLAQINKTLKDPSRFLEIIIELEKLAEQNGNKHQITIVEETKKAKTPSSAKYLLFRINLFGSFNNAMNFISDLENADFYSQIGKIEMSKMDKLTPEQIAEGAQIGDIETIMEVKIFIR